MSTESMQSGPRIVVGIDFDATGDEAFDRAVATAAGRPGAELHVLHAIADGANGSNRTEAIDRRAELLQRVPGRLRAYVANRSRALPAARAVPMHIHARLGPAAEALIQLAADVDAEVIVVGTHGRHGLQKLVLGSVAQRLVETAPCPVLVARPRDYAGIERSPQPEPVCPDCSTTRAASHGEQLWCEYHCRPQHRPHHYSWSETFSVESRGGGIV
jgi:nucleotide-binding universal stress UspA family protein